MSEERKVIQQPTPAMWGDGEPPSPIIYYDSVKASAQRRDSQQKSKIVPKEQECPCGGGMSCIVDRRFYGDWVMEDDLFLAEKCTLRNNCTEPYTEKQRYILDLAWRAKN